MSERIQKEAREVVATCLGYRTRKLARTVTRLYNDQLRPLGLNITEMNLMAAGARGCLDRGELSLYFTHRTGRFALLWLALRGLFGRLDQAADFEALCLNGFVVQTAKKTLRVAVDGEVIGLTPPLQFRVRPGALRVVAPPTADP